MVVSIGNKPSLGKSIGRSSSDKYREKKYIGRSSSVVHNGRFYPFIVAAVYVQWFMWTWQLSEKTTGCSSRLWESYRGIYRVDLELIKQKKTPKDINMEAVGLENKTLGSSWAINHAQKFPGTLRRNSCSLHGKYKKRPLGRLPHELTLPLVLEKAPSRNCLVI